MDIGLLALQGADAATTWMLSEGAALAAIALIGYLFGRRSQESSAELCRDGHLEAELVRAAGIAKSLRRDAHRIHCDATSQTADVKSFEAELRRLQSCRGEGAWQRLGDAAEDLLAPTLRLASLLGEAHEEMRAHAARLMTLTNSRIDALTGAYNRRALQEQLEVLLTASSNEEREFSVVLLSFASDQDGIDYHAVAVLAEMLKTDQREADFVARYSNDEMAVVMPKTSLAGALIFCQRVVPQAEQLLGRSVWGGAVESQAEDYPHRLLSRADSALYSARTCGETSVFQHVGGVLQRHQLTPADDVQQVIELRLEELESTFCAVALEPGNRRELEAKVDASGPVDVH